MFTDVNINTAICQRAFSEQEDAPQSRHTTQQFVLVTGMHHLTVAIFISIPQAAARLGG